MMGIKVLDKDERHAAVSRHLIKKLLKYFQSTSRGTKGDYRAMYSRRALLCGTLGSWQVTRRHVKTLYLTKSHHTSRGVENRALLHQPPGATASRRLNLARVKSVTPQ